MQSCKLWATIFVKLKGEAQSRFWGFDFIETTFEFEEEVGLWVIDFKVCLTSKLLASAFQTRLTSRLGQKTSISYPKWSVEAREGERGQTGSTGASKVVNCALCKERQVVCALLNLRNICFQGWVHMLPLQKKCSINNFILFSWNTTCPFFSSFRVERQLQKWIRHAKCFTMTLWECFLSRARVSRDISWLHFAHRPVQLVEFSNLQVRLCATVKLGNEYWRPQ